MNQKTEAQINEVEDPEVKHYEPKPEGEKKFWKQHIIKKHVDRNGNDDSAFMSDLPKDTTTRRADVMPISKKEVKISSPSTEKVINAVKSKVGAFKEHYGSDWKAAINGSLFEADNPGYGSPATSDSPTAGDQSMGGKIDNSGANQNAQAQPQKQAGASRDMLEKLAIQAADLHDRLGEGEDLDQDAMSRLSEAKDALDEVYEAFTQGGDTNAPKKVVGEELELDEATVKDATGTIVGTHHEGEGFKPNALGRKLGHKPHPTDVPKNTTITKRGRKVGSKSFGASKRSGETAGEAGAESDKPSFTDQLLKATDSHEGGHVTFDNGKTHHITRVHARAGLYHLGKPEKPAEKEKMRKHIGASKENFDAVRKSGGKLPEAPAKYDPDTKIKAKTAAITGGAKTGPVSTPRPHIAMARKIIAARKAGK